MGGDERGAGARGGAVWLGRLVVAWGVTVGSGLLLAWPAFALRTSGHKAWWYVVVLIGSLVRLVVALGAGIVVGGRAGARGATAVAALVLGLGSFVCWGIALGMQSGEVNQQIMHDRGVAMSAVVTGHWTTDALPASKSGIDVRLADGTRLSIRGAQPPVGTPVTVTRDPRGQAPPHLGPRPGAPDQTPTPLLWAFAASGTALALLCAGPLTSPAPAPQQRPAIG